MRLSKRIALLTALCLARPGAAYNVTDFGAIPSDGGNDSVAFAAALAAARAIPGPITIPAGVWLVDAGVLVVDAPGITLIGEGVGATVLVLQTSGDGIRFGQSPANFGDCGGVRDLSIRGGPERVEGRNIVVSGCWGGRIENVKLDHSPGHGLVFTCPAQVPNSACNGVWHIDNVHIEHVGATAGVWIETGSDRYFKSLFIRGERAVGSRGILLLDTGGDFFDTADVLFEEVGVSLEPPPAKGVLFVHFDHVYADSGLDSGWRFANTGGVIRGIDCATCWAGGNGLPIPNHPEFAPGYGTASTGFKIRNGDGIVFTAPRIWDTGGIGMEIGPSARNVQVSGGWAAANSAAAPGTLPGVLVNSAGGVSIGGGFRSGDPALAPQWHSCGIEISPTADNFTIADVDLRGNVSAGLCNAAGTGPTRIVHDVR